MIGTGLGPLIGGAIGETYGLSITFIVASFIMACSVIPLLISRDITFHTVTTRVAARIPVKDYIANASLNLESSVAQYLWPIFVFILIGNLFSIGIIFSAALLLSIAVALLAGKITDAGHGKILVNISSLARGVVHGMRLLAASVASAFTVNLASEVANTFKSTPYTTYFYAHARHYGILRYIRNMEVVASIFTAITWVVFYVLLQFVDVTQAMLYMFVLALLVSPLQALIATDHRSHNA